MKEVFDVGVFRCNENIKSYRYPVWKIVLCMAFIVLLTGRNYIVSIDNTVLNVFVKIVCFGFVITSVLCIYISVAEIILLHERREKASINAKTITAYSKDYSVDDILSLLMMNDIIEITIVSDNQIFKVGASSDCRPDSSRFFDKRYYINTTDYETIDNLKEVIFSNCKDGKLCVIAIDGVFSNP